MIAINIHDGEASARLERIALQAKNPRALLAEVGRRAGNELKKHFRLRDRDPNKLGGARTHFWIGVSRSVSAPVPMGSFGVSGVRIDITHPGFAQKVFGGRIVPKRARALTIPVHPAAHGRRASVLANEGVKLFVLKTGPSKLGVLAAKQPDGGMEVYYVLSRGVDQEADPQAMPAEGALAEAVRDQAEKHIERQSS